MSKHKVRRRVPQRAKLRYPATERQLHILLYTQDSQGTGQGTSNTDSKGKGKK